MKSSRGWVLGDDSEAKPKACRPSSSPGCPGDVGSFLQRSWVEPPNCRVFPACKSRLICTKTPKIPGNAQVGWIFWMSQNIQNMSKPEVDCGRCNKMINQTNCVAGFPQIIYWNRGPLEWRGNHAIAKKVKTQNTVNLIREGAFDMGLNMAALLRTLKVHTRAHTSRSGAFAQKRSDNPPAKQWRPQVFP